MILGEIRDYLKKRSMATLTDVSTHFDVSDESASLAIDFWVKKGKVRAVQAACGSSCGSSCGSGSKQYQWIEEIPVRWYNYS